MNRLLRLPALLAATTYPRSTAYQKIKQGLLPSPVKLGERSVAWSVSEVDAVVAARIEGKCDEEIRSLVALLERQRSTKV